ncbi:MAG: GxxExxY protein [Planctomycetota bacterium]
MFDLDQQTEELARRVIGAAIEVHKTLGPGFLESAYQNTLSIELEERGIPHQVEAPISILYKGKPVGGGRSDVIALDRIVLELKTVEAITNLHRAQLISYLKATNIKLGYIFNYNSVVLKDGMQRIIN